MKMKSKMNDMPVVTAGLSRVRHAVAAALWFSAQTALAQTVPADAPADDPVTGLAEMVVTGTRVVRDGYSAPTPVSVISTEELRATAPANITDFVNTLPSVAGSSTPANTSGSVSPGGAGIAALNLRSLGTNRTLVLFDGQRSVTSAATGQVDINTFPQALIERVEVVTGGASSAYGSDAIGGVVNFILNKKYTGVKTEVEYGETTYGDGGNVKFNLTAGTSVLDDKLHLLFSGEIYDQKGVFDAIRPWGASGYFPMQNSAANVAAGQPYWLLGKNTGLNSLTPGGLITASKTNAGANSTLLKGTYFGVNGTLNQLAYGTVGLGQFMRGGDWQYTNSGMVGTNSLNPSENRKSVFGRAAWKLNDTTEIYAQASYARYQGVSYYIQPTQTGITIKSDNAYIPTALKTQMTSLGLQSFTMGTSNADMPKSGSDNIRATSRFVVGANGGFTMFDKGFKWDAYFQHGETKTDEQLTKTWDTDKLTLATDAVLSNGKIVCRSSIANPTNGCVPLNRFGIGVASQEALDYVLGTPLRNQQFKQDVGAISFDTNEINGWAGPISLAFGVEARKESLDGQVDPIYQVLTLPHWKFGNYMVTKGDYSVKEGFVETVIPVLEGLDFNGAARYTNYSTSGGVTTWKLGFTYAPIDDIKFRFTKSRDIRAPNLSELYAAGTARSNSVPINGISTPFVQKQAGNPNIVPEEADAIGGGVVFTPGYIPGFAASVDMYSIKVNKVIDSLTAEQTVNFCYINNVQKYCDNIHYVGGVLSTIDLYFENLNKLTAKGMDVEASYRFGLADVFSAAAGEVQLRALGTRYIENITDNNVTAYNLAGANSGNTPTWRYRFSALYKLDSWTANLTMRGVSNGIISPKFVECTANCQTAADNKLYFTVNDNHVAGAILLDASITKSFDLGAGKGEIFLAANNLLNKDPPLVVNPDNAAAENTPAYLPTARNLYDVMGRTFRLGMRYSF